MKESLHLIHLEFSTDPFCADLGAYMFNRIHVSSLVDAIPATRVHHLNELPSGNQCSLGEKMKVVNNLCKLIDELELVADKRKKV